ncbi:MAG: transcription antitermination factor NusB [Terracidiphilus sp.]
MAEISPARKAAFAILLEVERGHAHSDDLLRGKRVDKLAPADRNLATALVLGVLRWQIRLDEQVRGFLERPKARLDPEVLIALRLGAFQLLHLDRIPAHAAIGESVELAKQAGHTFAARMVNAVLRKMAGHLHERAGAELAVVEAYPAWMVERWARFFGAETTRAVCAYGQEPPPTTIRIASPEVEQELVEAGIHLDAGKLLGVARRVMAGDVSAAAAFAEGRVRLQDEGSQLVAEIASACAGERDGSILDACAAPGGKTLILAERNPEARIVACEASPQRLAELQKRLAGFGERVMCRHGNAAELKDENAYDVVLADVPCSGTGTLGRNPEIRHRLRAEDLARQAERQRGILRAALRAVKPGGCAVYSTCSLEPEENEEIVAAVLGEMGEAEVVPVTASIGALRRQCDLSALGVERLKGCESAEGFLRLMPGALGTDGFFIAVIEKKA